jgi:autotransporter-associated beta strand protein
VQSLRLGNGTGATNVFNVDTLNIGTGPRDSGLFSFDTGTGAANGTVSINNRANNGATAFNMGTNGNATGAILANVFDVTGHTANLNFAAAAVGNVGGRLGNGTNTFSFDKGSLTFLNISASTRTTTGTMASTFNFGSASSTLSDTVNVTNGILQLGLASTVSGAIANGTVNIAGGTVNIGATSGTSITMASASIAGASSTALVNITGGTTTLSGDIVKPGGAGTTSATVTLNGAVAVLDMSNKKIGTAAQTVVFNAQAGTLKNLAELNGGGTLTKTTGGTLILEGTNSYTGATVISAGTLQVGSGSTTGTLGTNTGAIDNSGTLAINRSNTFALANAVTGSGALSQIGSGTTTLTGTNTYTGATTVSAGTLQVGVAGVGSTSATSAVTVNGSGAALAGTGTVNGNVTVTLGTIRPGDSAGTGVGTLNIGGALVVGTSAATTGTLSHGLIAAGYTDSAFNAAYDGTFNALTYLDNAKTAAANTDPLFAVQAAQAAALINSWKYTPTTSQNDYIKVNGTLTLNTLSVLELTDASSGGALVSSLQVGSVFNLMDWSGVRTGSAGSSTLSLPSTLSDALTAANLSFDASAFSTYGVVVVVPEPSRTLLFLFGLVVFMSRRRKR